MNPWSGIFYLFLVGFGWAPLFAFALGYLMGGRKYTWKEFVLGIIVFYAAYICGKVLVAHVFIPVTAPETYQLFAGAISTQPEASPWRLYLEYFFRTEDLEAIAGGRNYVSMVNNFSQAFGALVLWVLVRFKFKDRQGAKYTLAIPLILGTSIVLADLWMFWAEGCLYSFSTLSYSCVAPEWLQGRGWAMWEYFTGFGFGIGLILLLLREHPARYYETVSIPDSVIPPRFNRVVTFMGFICVMLYASLFFPMGDLLDRLGVQPWDLIVMGIGLVAILILTFATWKGKMHFPRWSTHTYALVILLVYWGISFVMDEFLTPRGTLDWRGVPDYLDIMNFVIGIPLMVALYFVSIKRSRHAENH